MTASVATFPVFFAAGRYQPVCFIITLSKTNMGADQEQQPLYAHQAAPSYSGVSIAMPNNFAHALVSLNLPHEVEIWAIQNQQDRVVQTYVHHLPAHLARERLISYHFASRKNISTRLGTPFSKGTNVSHGTHLGLLGVYILATVAFLGLSVVSIFFWYTPHWWTIVVGLVLAVPVSYLEGCAYAQKNLRYKIEIRGLLTASIVFGNLGEISLQIVVIFEF